VKSLIIRIEVVELTSSIVTLRVVTFLCDVYRIESSLIAYNTVGLYYRYCFLCDRSVIFQAYEVIEERPAIAPALKSMLGPAL